MKYKCINRRKKIGKITTAAKPHYSQQLYKLEMLLSNCHCNYSFLLLFLLLHLPNEQQAVDKSIVRENQCLYNSNAHCQSSNLM